MVAAGGATVTLPITRGRAAVSTDPITPALQRYADRGVFRGFRAAPAPRGRVDYQFLWLTRKPMHAVFDPRGRSLRFPALFPGIDKQTGAQLKSIVTSRASRDQPAHKRLDARRARITATVRRGDFWLSVDIRGHNHAYAVTRALNLINELFLALHEGHPEYLVERFGISTE
jgi:hypothetical protein